MHRQFSARNEDDGFTLIEVIVAMVVFAIVATGFIYVATSALVSTRDTRARVVAANLASQRIDFVRSQNALDVRNVTDTVTLNGDTFHVKTSWAWATAGGGSATCESGPTAGGAFTYKKVTVKVTWDNMPSPDQAVYSDTSMVPKTKINDVTRGTVLVGVIDAAGVGVSGVTVTLTPASGVAPVTTDSDGCAYLLKVPEGSYTVGIAKTGYVNDQHLAAPTATVPVTKGGSSRVSFAYDRAATFTATYAGGTASLPTNLTTTLLSTYGNRQVTATSNANPKTFGLYPVPSGYSIVAGGFSDNPDNAAASCLAPDPGAWTETSTTIGQRPGAVGAAPGGSAPVAVSMGVVALTGLSGSDKFLTAVYVGGGDGDPGCGSAATPTYTFGNTTIVSNAATLALPYGTWKIYRGATSGAATTQITTGMTVKTTGTVSGTGPTTIVTLDPRVPK